VTLFEIRSPPISIKGSKAPHEILSNREFEIMKMIAAGKQPRVIVKQLFLSPRTVNTYRARILKKLKVKTNTELIHYVIEHNLLD
jgi:DNA-binding CsgD family transcriptional regulator